MLLPQHATVYLPPYSVLLDLQADSEPIHPHLCARQLPRHMSLCSLTSHLKARFFFLLLSANSPLHPSWFALSSPSTPPHNLSPTHRIPGNAERISQNAEMSHNSQLILVVKRVGNNTDGL